MSKEAEEFIKREHPDPDSLLTGNIERDCFMISNITALMQSYADQQVEQAFKIQEFIIKNKTL